MMDFAAKRAELLKAKEQLVANLNFVSGQLALLDELEKPEREPPMPSAEDPPA